MKSNLKFLLLLILIYHPNSSFSATGIPNCELISTVTRCTVSHSKLTKNITRLVEIKDRTGARHAALYFRYSKRQKLDILLTQIEDTLGHVIRVLKRSDFKDRNAFDESTLFVDDFIRSCDLNYNIYPYRIRYQYESSQDEFTQLVDWDPYLDWDVPTRYARLEVIVPRDYPVKIYCHLVGEPVKREMDGNVSYTVEVTQVKLPVQEIYNLTSSELGMRVWMIPAKFDWDGPGSSESWEEYGKWINHLNQGTDDLPETEKALVLNMVKKKVGKLDIIDTLYRYLQDRTRYIAVYVGVGGLKPYPASYVCTNKYGDCKALAVYMQALLKVAGITSFYTLVQAGDGAEGIIPEMPTNQFNHAILTIPLGKDTMFLDCTRKNVPAGYFGTFTQGREACLVVPGAARLIKIPFLKSSEVLEEHHHTYTLAAFAPCKVEIENKLRGNAFDLLKGIQEQLNQSESEFILRERYFNFPSFDLNHWEIKQTQKDSAFLILNASLQLANYLKGYGEELGFQINPIYLPNFENPGKRVSPVRLEYPVNIADDYVYQLTGLRKGSYTPEDKEIISKFGRYSQKITFEGGNILFHREFELYRGEYSLEDYAEFYDFIKKIKSLKISFLLTKF